MQTFLIKRRTLISQMILFFQIVSSSLLHLVHMVEKTNVFSKMNGILWFLIFYTFHKWIVFILRVLESSANILVLFYLFFCDEKINLTSII